MSSDLRLDFHESVDDPMRQNECGCSLFKLGPQQSPRLALSTNR